LRPKSITNVELPLTPAGTHIWRPFAPTADIDVDLEAKGWHWSGHGYFDANFGTRALEQDFNYWTWGRYPVSTGTQCFYDLELRNGETAMHAIDFNLLGDASEIPIAPPAKRFRNSLWAVRRETRCDENANPKQVQNLLDAPFTTDQWLKHILTEKKVPAFLRHWTYTGSAIK
jgi:carotenoid 1,2-hydratase